MYFRYVANAPKEVKKICVLGNHEFWDRDFNTSIAEYRKFLDVPYRNSHLLENDEVVMSTDSYSLPVRFLGCTLWTDFNSGIDLVMAKDAMADYHAIRNGMRYVSPHDVYERHLESRAWLEKKLAEKFSGYTVVVTHHSPSFQCHKGTNFHSSKLNTLFSSNMEDLILKYSPDLWIHGHIHDSADYFIDRTRVICNPHGYSPWELNPKFNNNLVVEI